MGRSRYATAAHRARRQLATAAALVSLLAPTAAAAQEEDGEGDNWDGEYDIEYEKRSDFTFGLQGGLMMGNAAGYPNTVNKIDNDQFEVDSGVAVGGGGTFWIGGALRDWFVFGLGITGANISGDADVSGGAFIFRTEVYPFFYSQPWGKNLGIGANFGIGGLTAEKKGQPRADGGAMSATGIGAFYELWNFGSFASGPSLDYHYFFSRSMRVHTATAGLRLAFYGGP